MSLKDLMHQSPTPEEGLYYSAVSCVTRLPLALETLRTPLFQQVVNCGDNTGAWRWSARPWQRTRLVAVKARTLEKLLEGAKRTEAALYERRIAVADKRRKEETELKARRERRWFQHAYDAAEATVQGRLTKSDTCCQSRRHVSACR